MPKDTKPSYASPRPTDLGLNLTRGMLDSLGRSIVTGAFDEVPFPTEAEISVEFGVSRSVTREAVKMLTAKGLVSARPRQGTVVQSPIKWNLFDGDVLQWLLDREPSLRLLQHFAELLAGLEPEAAALAAEYANNGDMDRLIASVDRLTKAQKANGDVLSADIAFHIVLLETSQNPFYIQLRNLAETALRTANKFRPTADSRSMNIKRHAVIRDAVLNRDAASARKHMRALVLDTFDPDKGG